jgi:3-oxoacyl-[acyl-carrier protein] reductase
LALGFRQLFKGEISMDLGIKGKNALVAASSKGLGRAVAEELAAEGVNLVMCSRSGDALETASQQIREDSGVNVLAVPTDLTDANAVEHLLDRTQKEIGQIDILVTNTGGPPPGPFESHSSEAWSQAVHQNLYSVLNLTRGLLPAMLDSGWGRIVNITSVAVKEPVDGLILSNSIRAAVTGFAKTLATEVAGSGVTVNNVMPGFTMTDRLESLAKSRAEQAGSTMDEIFEGMAQTIPMGRIGTPREFAAMVGFLASDRASYITGVSIPVDGGVVKGLI